MSIKLSKTATPTRKHFNLSELPDWEIAEIYEQVQQEEQKFYPLEDEYLIPSSSKIIQEETDFYTNITAHLTNGSISYEQAALITALFMYSSDNRENQHTALMISRNRISFFICFIIQNAAESRFITLNKNIWRITYRADMFCLHMKYRSEQFNCGFLKFSCTRYSKMR